MAPRRQGRRRPLPRREAAHRGGEQAEGDRDVQEREGRLGIQLHEVQMEGLPDEEEGRAGQTLHEEVGRGVVALRRAHQTLPLARRRPQERLRLPPGPLPLHEGHADLRRGRREHKVRGPEARELPMRRPLKGRRDLQEMGVPDSHGTRQERVRLDLHERQDGGGERRRPDHDRRRLRLP